MILAAGRGERLAPLTDRLPKPLIEIGGETLIERHLRSLARAGMHEIVVNLSHLGDRIEARLGNGERYGVEITYSREPDGPLETAGGIFRALPLLGEAPFLVVNADIWTDFEPTGLVLASGDDAHLVLVPNPPHNPAGDFSLAAGRVSRRARNDRTYAGIAVLRPTLFEALQPGPQRLAPLLFAAAAAARVSGQLHAGRWLDIGTPERLAQARRLVGREAPGRT